MEPSIVKKNNIFMLDTIKRILKHGIYLGDISSPDYYMMNLCKHFNSNSPFRAVYQEDKVIIETQDFEPIAGFRIRRNTLELASIGKDDFFNCFMDILEFVCKPLPKEKEKEKKQIDDSEFEWI